MKKIIILLTLLLCFSCVGCTEKNRQTMNELNQKVVYLTFDDVPFSYTIQILDILDAYNVKGTFFMLGDYMNTRPEVTKEVAARGHALGLHGLTHKRENVYGDEYSPLFEMNDAQNILYEITGMKSNIIRLPWGSYNLTEAQRTNLIQAGFVIWDWNVDTEDAFGNDVPSEKIVEKAILGIERYKNPVVLMHNMKSTAKALPQILEYIKKNGYKTGVLTQADYFELK